MQTQLLQIRHHLQAFVLAASVSLLAFSGWASADPPSRVARLGYMTGAVSFSPAGENDWVQARVNRPLTTGDRLWADARARAEIQIGGAVIRMNAGTGVAILNLDDRIAQLQLTQGTLNVRVRRLERNQIFEVDTPNLAFTLRQPGEYRIEVDPDGRATEIYVRRGQGEVYGEGASYVIDSRQSYRFSGIGLREYDYVDVPRFDEFDRWSSDRDRRYENSSSARYVSQDVVGYEDLDANGTWRSDATYGNVWFPSRVSAGWAPYRDGHWAWIDPWGWTWVDDAPWGYAVSHYGRWTNLRGTWGWVPGPVRSRAYYAPALVAFVGGNNFRLSISSGNVGGVAWFPLAPREIYRPSYAVSRGYFENINVSNTVINTTVINNYYNNSNVTNIVYANRQVPGAVVAVPTTAFVQSQQVSRVAVPVSPGMTVGGPVAFIPAAAPTETSVRGAASQGGRPPDRAFERAVVARTEVPASPVGFAVQQQQLSARQGRPLDETARRELRPSASVQAPVVNVVSPAQIAPPTALPPRVAPAGNNAEGRGRSEQHGNRDQRGQPGMSPAPPVQFAPPAQPQDQRGNVEQRGRAEQRGQPSAVPVAPPQFAPPPAAEQYQDQRGKSEQRGNREQRGQPFAPPPSPVPVAPPVPQPQAAPPAPAAQPPDQRGKSEQRGNREQRGQAVAPPPPSPVPVAPPAPAAQAPDQRGNAEQRGRVERGQPAVAPVAPVQVAPPQVAPPRPTAQPPEQRGNVEQRGNREQRGQPVPPSPPPQAAPGADPRNQDSRPDAGKKKDKKRDADDQKRDEEDRKNEQRK